VSKRTQQKLDDESQAGFVREPLAVPEAVSEARSRPMSERLEQALSWNSVAVELRAGVIQLNGDSAS
jgi:hypothetical protein